MAVCWTNSLPLYIMTTYALYTPLGVEKCTGLEQVWMRDNNTVNVMHLRGAIQVDKGLYKYHVVVVFNLKCIHINIQPHVRTYTGMGCLVEDSRDWPPIKVITEFLHAVGILGHMSQR